VQRTVLYLGEINDQQQVTWRKTLSVFDEQEREYENLSLFPDDREIPADAVDSLQVKLSGLELRRPRLFGSCWLGCQLWQQLGLHEFLGCSPGRNTGRSSLGKSVTATGGEPAAGSGQRVSCASPVYLSTPWMRCLEQILPWRRKNRLYRCMDRVLEHKQDLFLWLRQKWADLFQAEFEVLLYDLTSTYLRARWKRTQGQVRSQSR